MTSGGARAIVGPPPDPNALGRERDAATWQHLPAVGRQGPPPEWPITPAPSRREQVLWERLWARPQAVMWEANHQEDQVAVYCRTFAEAERRNARVDRRNLLKQQEEILGISLSGMLRHRWIIASKDGDPQRPELVRGQSARERLGK